MNNHHDEGKQENEEEIVRHKSVAEKQQRNDARNKFLLNLLNVPYSGRPKVTISYVPPTLFQVAHEILAIGSERLTHKLYLGPKTSASERALEALIEANIVGVVNCTPHVPCYHRTHFRYCQVPVQDVMSEDIMTYLERTSSFIDAMLNEGSVLVHCEQGMSRSATVTMAYLMRYHRMTREQSYVFCKAKRPMINPNEGFWKQLETYEELITKKCSNAATTDASTDFCLTSKSQLPK